MKVSIKSSFPKGYYGKNKAKNERKRNNGSVKY
jgi:hypothetical protein